MVAGDIEFDWDDENIRHLANHEVAPAEFEQVMNNDPLDVDYDVIDDEGRYRSVGLTDGGRFLLVVWTVRGEKVRAVSAFPATVRSKKAFLRRSQ